MFVEQSCGIDHERQRRHDGRRRSLRARAASLYPHLGDMRGGVEDRYRQSPVETILAKDRHFACRVNPYAIMKQSRVTREQPYYFIAVARV